MSQITDSQFSKEDLLLIGTGVVVIGAGAYIGSQVAAGVFVGAITAAGATYTIYKTRQHAPRLFNVIVDKPLLSDIAIDATVFVLIGGATVTGITAGASASLFTSIGISCLRKLGKVPVEPISMFKNPFKSNEVKQTQEVVVVAK